LAEAREQKAIGGGGLSGGAGAGSTLTAGSQRLGAGSRFGERAPASWRWEKQELERQLKDYRKKLDDIYAEMKRNQVKWKAAGEDIARVHYALHYIHHAVIALQLIRFIDLFVFICVYFVCFCFMLHSCCIIMSTVGWT